MEQTSSLSQMMTNRTNQHLIGTVPAKGRSKACRENRLDVTHGAVTVTFQIATARWKQFALRPEAFSFFSGAARFPSNQGTPFQCRLWSSVSIRICRQWVTKAKGS
jgi:hypothetical protein